VAQLRALAKALKLTEVVLQGKYLRIGPVKLPESMQLRLSRLYPGSLYKTTTNTVLITLTTAAAWAPSGGGTEMVDTSLLKWATEAIENLVIPTTPMKASKM
jgi:transcription-repair coupling factor (superfamily II helicase)